jgi:hypothetical protein
LHDSYTDATLYYAFLKAADRPISQEDLITQVDSTQNTIRNRISPMIEAGLVNP